MNQLDDIKLANAQLRDLKQAEMEYQRKYFNNCAKVIAMLKDKRKDFVIESLSQIDASVSAISTDVQAFKNIRNYLFTQITEEIHKHKQAAEDEKSNLSATNNNHETALSKNKLYLYLFHLFESVVNNMAQLVQKTKYTILSQCGEQIENFSSENGKRHNHNHAKNTIVDTINTIATGSVTTDKD